MLHEQKRVKKSKDTGPKIQGLEESSAQYQELLLDSIKMAGCFHISARDGVRVDDLQIFLEKVKLDTRDK